MYPRVLLYFTYDQEGADIAQQGTGFLTEFGLFLNVQSVNHGFGFLHSMR